MCLVCYLKNLYPVCVYIFESHKNPAKIYANTKKKTEETQNKYDEKSTTGAEEKRHTETVRRSIKLPLKWFLLLKKNQFLSRLKQMNCI